MQRRSILEAIVDAFAPPALQPPLGVKLVELSTLVRQYPHQAIVIFPECTTTNGRGILPLTSCLNTLPTGIKIYPTNLRYTPADVTTPLPDSYLTFLWSLLSIPTHCIRVRIAENVTVGTNEIVEGQDRRLLNYVADALARLGRVKRVGLSVEDKQGFVKAWARRKSQPSHLD